jgi:hypothetical protein
LLNTHLDTAYEPGKESHHTGASHDMTLFSALFIALVNGFAPPPADNKPRFDVTKEVRIDSSEIRAFAIDGAVENYHLTVIVRSKGSPVAVYLVSTKDSEKAIQILSNGKVLSTFLVCLQGVEEEVSFSVLVKSKAEVAILIASGEKSTNVSLKITGK